MEGSVKKHISDRKFYKRLFLTNKGLTTKSAEGRLNRLAQEKIDFLEELGMIQNKITSFPKRIFECNQLRLLSLCHNLLTEIPSSIALLVNLEVLSVYNNKIGFISPRIITLTKLRVLSLGKNDRLPLSLAKDSNQFEETQQHLQDIATHFTNVMACRCLLWCIPQMSDNWWLPKDIWKLIAKLVIKI